MQNRAFCVKLGFPAQRMLYLINNYKSFDTHTYTCLYFKINIQFRCSNPCADSQVDQPVANAKVIQKLLSFLKRMWLAVRFLQGG